jgi:ABC-type Fe3+-hydroxamate transport system substrate-binding protein
MSKNLKTIVCIFVTLLCTCSTRESEPSRGEIRIVSLSPSITASLIDLGFSDEIVGRSAFCEEVASSIPVVGDLYAVDSHLEDLSQRGLFILRSWKLNTIEDIKKLSTDLLTVFTMNQSPVEFEFGKIVISDDPTLLMTRGSEQNVGICFGKNTYLDDIWGAIGGVNALKKDGWQMLSLEDIARLSPSRILIVSDTPFINRSPVESLGIPVIQFVHKDVLIPSTRILQVTQSLLDQLAETE